MLKQFKQFKKLALVSLIATVPLSTTALADVGTEDLVLSLGFLTFSAEDELSDTDVSLGALWTSVGYKFHLTDNLSVIPTGKIGIGLGSDSMMIDDVEYTVEVDNYYAAALRAEYSFNNGAYYAFGGPSYAQVNTNVVVGSDLLEDNAWEFGLGVGVGIRLPKDYKIEVGYENYDGSAVFSAAMQFQF